MSHTLGTFYTWRSAILKSELPATTRHVLLTLSCYMNEAGEGCFPSLTTLAEATGLDRRTVQRHLADAGAAGWIEKRPRERANGASSSNCYQATVPEAIRQGIRGEGGTPPRGGRHRTAGGAAQDRPKVTVHSTVQTKEPLVREDADDPLGGSAIIDELHEHFNRVRGGRPLKLTEDRRRKYRARLKTFTAPELKRAIEAALAREFYRGKNDDGTRYDFPETILKNDGAVDRHLQLEHGRAEEAARSVEGVLRQQAGSAWVQIWSAARRGYTPPLETPAARAAYAAVKDELELELGLAQSDRASDALLSHFLGAYLEHCRAEEETEEAEASSE